MIVLPRNAYKEEYVLYFFGFCFLGLGGVQVQGVGSLVGRVSMGLKTQKDLRFKGPSLRVYENNG